MNLLLATDRGSSVSFVDFYFPRRSLAGESIDFYQFGTAARVVWKITRATTLADEFFTFLLPVSLQWGSGSRQWSVMRHFLFSPWLRGGGVDERHELGLRQLSRYSKMVFDNFCLRSTTVKHIYL